MFQIEDLLRLESHLVFSFAKIRHAEKRVVYADKFMKLCGDESAGNDPGFMASLSAAVNGIRNNILISILFSYLVGV